MAKKGCSCRMEGGREFQVRINAWGKERMMVLFDRGGRVRLTRRLCRWILALVAVYADGLCDVLVGAVVAADMASEVHTSACTADRDR